MDPTICGDDGPITPEQCALWLDAKYRRHEELEDRAAAMWLRKLDKENDELRGCVAALDAADTENERLRAALEKIASDARYLTYDTGDCTFEALTAIRSDAKAALETCTPSAGGHENG
jgi:hypothetical protein